jgi:hypothetical protein
MQPCQLADLLGTLIIAWAAARLRMLTHCSHPTLFFRKHSAATAGQDKCTPCQAGTFNPSAGRTSQCTPCERGQYASAGTAVCTKCHAGLYTAGPGSTSSNSCMVRQAGRQAPDGEPSCAVAHSISMLAPVLAHAASTASDELFAISCSPANKTQLPQLMAGTPTASHVRLCTAAISRAECSGNTKQQQAWS